VWLVRQQRIIERALFAFGDLVVRVRHIAEGKGLRGARGLTRRPHLADRLVLPVGGNARLGDTLQAKTAFLHHPAPHAR